MARPAGVTLNAGGGTVDTNGFNAAWLTSRATR
ncbi:Putative mannan endo-1,4-beta-mannosidase 9 precursor (Beta-mannanase 9) (Endo-beta-1,4-mannanase 9) (OsMan9) (OsMANP) (fragment) [Candidatus Methylomirabilis oxygeniifera]|uniref:Putative mannan endo-1,4-beta-mannosidase 9 (Beta-mannanase 9) (Endo-beta-1,4-mannanase 9) (OsMan9) (OsMANP) n=1 Tax=Methylomirabilis oxygeniifera TaxID=671143 RepID=D5MEX2_METO1